MEENKKKKPLIQDSDHVLKSRRDFLAQGLFASAASMVLPFNAMAQEGCDMMAAVDNPMIPVIVVDLAGGSNIAGSNVMVGGAGGQLDFLNDYRTIGLLSGEHPSMTNQLEDLNGNRTNPQGLLFHAQSGLLAGIKATASAAARSKTDGIIMCATSDDDTGNNPHNPMYWFHKAGARGAVAQLIGSQGSTSGGNSQAPAMSIDMSIAPLTISRPADVLNLVGMGARTRGFAANRESFLLRALDALSESRIKSLSRRQMPDVVKDLVLCKMTKTQNLLQSFSESSLDVAADPAVQAVFNNLNDGTQQRTASVAKMVLDGFAASGTITIGGYDYHDGTRQTGDARDRQAGEVIGRILELAQRKQKQVVIYLFTDGGVGTNGVLDGNNGRLVWSGDSGQRSSSVMLAFDPVTKPPMRSNSRQMGRFKTGGSVENNASPMSNSVNTLAKAVVLNYLALHGLEGDMEKVVGDNPFATSMNQHLFFRKIA